MSEDGPTIVRSRHGVVFTIEVQNWDQWNWTEDVDDMVQPLLAQAALIIGPVIMDALTKDACVTSSVENGRFVGNFLASDYTISAEFDPTEMIDNQVEDCGDSEEQKREAEVVLAWLEAQADRLREALAAAKPGKP